MVLFSRFKMSSKPDKKDKRLSTTKKGESVNMGKPKYHHTPTHAAVDALNGAPSCWRKIDEQRIREILARKSQILMFGRDNAMAEFLRSMPQPPMLEELAAMDTPTATPRWKRETASGRNSAFIPLQVNINSLKSGLSSADNSAEMSPVPSLTSSDFTSAESVASTFDLAYRQQKRPHPRPKLFAHNDVFSRLQSASGRKLCETTPHDSLFPIPPERPETYEAVYPNQPVLRKGPNRSVFMIRQGQRPLSSDIVTILE